MRYKNLSILLLIGCFAACSRQTDNEPVEVSVEAAVIVAPTNAAGPDLLTARQMQQWLHSCALCHVTGVAAAPLVGNVEQWRPRREQGIAVLLTHTLEGFNAMPPLGYCMSCEADDFSAMIDFMVGEAR